MTTTPPAADPAGGTIPLTSVAGVYKRRAETAEALNLSLAHERDQLLATVAAKDAEIAALKAPTEDEEAD